jgi:hypothetical protein
MATPKIAIGPRPSAAVPERPGQVPGKPEPAQPVKPPPKRGPARYPDVKHLPDPPEPPLPQR